jgi:hypothetical protein
LVKLKQFHFNVLKLAYIKKAHYLTASELIKYQKLNKTKEFYLQAWMMRYKEKEDIKHKMVYLQMERLKLMINGWKGFTDWKKFLNKKV